MNSINLCRHSMPYITLVSVDRLFLYTRKKFFRYTLVHFPHNQKRQTWSQKHQRRTRFNLPCRSHQLCGLFRELVCLAYISLPYKNYSIANACGLQISNNLDNFVTLKKIGRLVCPIFSAIQQTDQ